MKSEQKEEKEKTSVTKLEEKQIREKANKKQKQAKELQKLTVGKERAKLQEFKRTAKEKAATEKAYSKSEAARIYGAAAEHEKELKAKAKETREGAASQKMFANQRLKAAAAERKVEGKEQARLGLIEQAKMKRIHPTAFASQNAPVFSETGQEAKDTPEEHDIKQRRELRRQLGDQAKSAQPQNFVVEKPLAPNAMDLYESQKIRQRDTIRNQKAFAPVQKL